MAERVTGDYRKYMDKRYLGAWDVPEGEDLILTIDEVWRDEVKSQRGEEKKLTLHFKEDYKPMILNATNSDAISKAYNTRITKNWEKKKIAIYVTKVPAFGDVTDALRIRPYPPRTDEITCEECGRVIEGHGKFSAKAIANNSLTKFNRFLCYDCAIEAKNSANE